MYKKRILLIGAFPTDDPKTHGGTTILVEQLYNYCQEKDIVCNIIKTNKYEGKFAFIKNYLYVLFYYLKVVTKNDIVFSNVARNGMYFLAPVLLVIAHIKGKKFVSRIFGGNSIELYNTKNNLKKYLLRYVFKHSDLLFFETKYLVNYFNQINKNTFWFPNTRKVSMVKRDITHSYSKKFVYIGQIKKEKGIDELLDAFNTLDKSYQLSIYGNIIENNYEKKFNDSHTNIIYKGKIEHENVNYVLSQNDILILPSYREGYPGVIIEAFSVGLPVIATNLTSIQEMVDSSCGVLIPPQDANALQRAVEEIKNNSYSTLSKTAIQKFNNYKYEDVYQNIFMILER